MKSPKPQGKIIIPSNTNIWPHELETAKALADYGYIVEFKQKLEGYKINSADAYMDGKMWEFKAPNGRKISAIERNLRRAKNQSKFIIFDSARIKKIPDSAIMREILTKAPLIKSIQRIIFVNKRRECIDIYRKIK